MDQTAEPATARSTILIADDDPYVLESTAILLEESGYGITTCRSAPDALARFMTAPTDVVLTDIKMPHVSGVELLGRIHAIDPQVPVVLMTAYAELDMAL